MVFASPLVRLRNSRFFSLLPVSLLFCIPFVSGQTFNQGQPIVGVGTSSPVSSKMFLDASQFPGAPDICAQINAAYMSASFTGNIDATAFSGLQPCLSNPFHGKNAVVHLYLNPNVDIITSVPWFTPQLTHSIEGYVAGNIAQSGGATIEACGTASAGYNMTTNVCVVGTSPTSVPRFPNWISISTASAGGVARTATCSGSCPPLVVGQVVSIQNSSLALDNGYQTLTGVSGSTFTYNASASSSSAGSGGSVSLSMTFSEPHGPFLNPYSGTPAPFACVLCMGGEGSGGSTPLAEGNGWNGDGDAWTLRNVKVELGGNSNIFGVYTMNSQERSMLDQTRGGPACETGGNCADVFFDRATMPMGTGGPAGVTRPIVRDFNMANETLHTTDCLTCYAIAFEGANTSVQVNGCATPPTAFVETVASSSIKTIGVGYPGAGCPASPTCVIKGAPQVYGGSTNVSASCTASASGGVLLSVTVGLTGNTGYSNSPQTGGPLLDDINVDPNSNARFLNGVWLEGIVNAYVNKVHCLNITGECVAVGSSGYTLGGIFTNIDGNGTTAGPLHLGYGIDNSQFVASIVSGATNLLVDDRNATTLTTAAHGNTLGQYNPSALNLLSQPTVQEIANSASTAPVLNKLVILVSGATPTTVTVAATSSTTGVEGICVGNCVIPAPGIPANAQIAREGIAPCIFDASLTPTAVGHYVQASTSAGGDCHDAGAAYPTSGQVLGRVLSSTATGGTYPILLYSGGIVPFSVTGTSGGIPYFSSGTTLGSSGTLNTNVLVKGGGTGAAPTNSGVTDNGTTVSTAETFDLTNQALVFEFANYALGAPTLNKLVQFANSSGVAKATTAGTGSTNGVVGICLSNCASSGTAQIAIKGTTSCVFDGSTVAGDYVQVSTSTAGDCHDFGSTYPTSNQVVGRALANNTGSGTYGIFLY